MPRAYIRIDPQLFERKMIDQKYPASTFSAFVGALCLAESQPTRGVFRDRRVLKALLGRALAPQIPVLIERGDLIEDSTGRLRVEGWEHWQEGDLTVADRMRRLRQRKSGTNGVTPPVTAPVTPSDTASVTAPVTASRAGSRATEAVSGGISGGGGPSRPPTEMSTDERRELLTTMVATAQAILDDEQSSEPARRAAQHAVDKGTTGLAELDQQQQPAEPPEVSFEAPVASEEATGG